MHDVTGTALVVDLPTNDLMSKVESVVEPDMATDLSAKKKMIIVGTIDETENTDASSKDSKNEDPEASAEASSVGMPGTLQPVTPEPSKATEEATVEQPKHSKDQKEEKKEELAATRATPASAPPKYNLTLQNNPRPNRGRVVSLDRARSDASDSYDNFDGYRSPDNPFTDDERCKKQASGSGDYDSPDSSDDDSSYFASNLPKPKSSRSVSYHSAGSAPARTSSYYPGSVKQESDASLSFSDESDDETPPNVHISPMIPPTGTVADMHLYPQRITRMHSVSSLISSASSEGHHDGAMGGSHHMSTGSLSSAASGSTSDLSVRAELQNMAVVNGRSSSGTSEASGHRSPTMGNAVNHHYGPHSPHMTMQSPPPIMQSYMQSPMSHPTPQTMSTDQMAAWAAAGNAAAQMYPQGQQQQHGYGSTNQGMNYPPHAVGIHRYNSESSVPFIYSEDDDTLGESMMFNQMAGSSQAAGGAPAANNGAYPNGVNTRPRQGPSGGGAGGAPEQFNGTARSAPGQVALVGAPGHDGGDETKAVGGYQKKTFQVYWQRWIMLFYMSALNLLSDWTCYSVAPIALLTKTAFGDIDPEQLVVIFLSANALASACEPIILARLGLRRTVLVGSLMLMIGSVIKSGGIPPIFQSNLIIGHEEWRIYLGFFLVGLSQPLYQCTPALLSASWFPEKERTMATGVALNANQLGIGFAFVFGTLLVDDSNDVPAYFGLLSLLSTIAFVGTLIQFDDAPPTPPSDTARVMKGSIQVNLPSVDTIVQSVRGFAGMEPPVRPNHAQGGITAAPSPASDPSANSSSGNPNKKSDTKSKKSSRASTGRRGSSTRRRAGVSRTHTANTDNGLLAPSPALSGRTEDAMFQLEIIKAEAESFGVDAPSPMMPGRVGQSEQPRGEDEGSPLYEDAENQQEQQGLNNPNQPGDQQFYPQYMGMPGMPPPGAPGGPPPPGGPGGVSPPFGAFPHPHYQYPYWDPRVQQQMQQQQAMYQQQYQYYQQQAPQPPQPYYYNNMPPYPPHFQNYEVPMHGLPATDYADEGAEPIITLTDHHLDIEIRDDQVIRSLRACLARPGFIHALVSFTASGIVINTLSTFMDYLVRLNGAPRYYTGIVGGTFQAVVMASSLIIGSLTDRSRAYYSVTIGMLVMGAFALAECGVNLDSNRGADLRWSLIVVAALVGPLQPVSTELGVDVAYPLSENTVLVIQQLFSNLLSALFIPFFKALKDVGTQAIGDTETYERPEYTFSFYLLIVIHAGATVFFATFNGRYLRYEHELQKKAEEQQLERESKTMNPAFHPHGDQEEYDDSYENERQPLVGHPQF